MGVRALAVLWIGALLLFFAADAMAKPARDAAYEKKTEEKLTAIDPSLVPTFQAGTAAYDAGDFATAKTLFAKVWAAAPKFDAGARRLCASEIALGDFKTGIEHCRNADDIEQSPENDSALALALVTSDKPGKSALREANDLAMQAAALKPNDTFIQAVLCEVALKANDVKTAEACTRHLVDLAPDDPQAHVMRAMSLGIDGDLGGGEKELDRAHELGLPDAQYRGLRDGFHAARPLTVRAFLFLAPILALWGAGLALLFLTGAVFSRLTLRAAQRPPKGVKDLDSTEGERRLRRMYRWVVTAGALYFYVSIPLVAIVVVAAAGAFILTALAVGHVPLQWLLIALLVALYTLRAIFRSLTHRVKDEAPGIAIDLAREPKLAAVLAETAGKIGTRPVDAVYLVADATVAVTERGGLVKQLRGRAERALILGVGALDGMGLRAMKAILAHEYGHFRNEDTAGGGIALAARRSWHLMALHMAVQGVATWYNPAWWFVRGYGAVYLRISQGASRLQEILADRWAVLAFGAVDFIAGLRHVVQKEIEFEHHVDASLKEVVERKVALQNLYTFTPEKAAAAETIREQFEAAWNREPSPYDSHPRCVDRAEWARALGVAGTATSDDHETAWSIFEDRAAIERLVTADIRAKVAKRIGVTLPSE